MIAVYPRVFATTSEPHGLPNLSSRNTNPSPRIELWGGVECTTNRVGDEYFEQLDRSGHSSRIDDLDRFAELGISALRQPVLWERICPGKPEDADWSWADRWLTRLRELNIRPIAGLVHHGSGPRSTDLMDPAFPEKLAEYAGMVARHYPWLSSYTPVNEPLTTARFSGLYGHWYPHRRDDRSFLTALLNQCRAAVLSMKAIREIQPQAQLVQTDDLGKTFSTPELQYQADFENERRWLAFDLLCGRVSHRHPLWSYLRHVGVPEKQILWFAENPCPPDVFGFNYYLSSERFLDHRVDMYPSLPAGGNGRQSYIDIEAARVRAEGIAGAGGLLMEAWQRFGKPMAITECHNGCTREEQLRWVLGVWRDAKTLRDAGVNIRAVTLWSLLGAFDWNTLVTQKKDCYEPGVFDIRAPKLHATAIAQLGSELARGIEPDHPLLEVPGWWKRDQRFNHGVAVQGDGSVLRLRHHHSLNEYGRPVLITGGTGTLGRAFERVCLQRGIPYRLVIRRELDIANLETVRSCLESMQPWAVINAAGYVRVDDAESDALRCHRENAEGPAVLAAECARRGVRLVTFSSDLVFDGDKRAPYVETDLVRPLNEYGISKVKAENHVLELCPSALIVRTSAFFGPWDEYNFVTIALRNIAAGQEFRAAADAVVSPTYVPDLINATLDLLIDGVEGIWHLANNGEVSWASLAAMTAEMKGFNSGLVVPCSISDFGWPARRPAYSALGSDRALFMPSLENAIDRYMRECVVDFDAHLLAA